MKKTNEAKTITRYSPSIGEGLSSYQVNERISLNCVNKVQKKYSKSYFNIIISNVFTFFNLLGLTVFIAYLAIGASIGEFFFTIFYLANTSIGIIQEVRAKRCIDKLSLLSNNTVKVIRDGEIIEILTTEIVLDDVVYLGLGNQIPTDCIVIQGEIEVNESLLTGESVPIKKKTGDLLLAGSFITSGVCYAKAEKVGKDNYVETLSAKAKQYKKPNSEIMNSIKMIIKLVSFAIFPIATAFLIKSFLLFETSVSDTIQGAGTVVIGMIPAGMMLLTSVALALGIIKLAKHKTLVQDLYSLEMLARVDTICFDKTGTITDGNMSVKELILLKDNDKFECDKIISSIVGILKDDNNTANALRNYFTDQIYYKSIKKIPFNSAKKYSGGTFEEIGTCLIGAPEFILSTENYTKIKEKINDYASKGYRVLILAHSNNIATDDSIPTNFEAIGIILIVDNVREDAIATIKWFKENNVEVKVISGDNPITVAEVSARVGIENADKYISLEGLSDEEVYNSANQYTVFGRVSPEQKAILVKALKDNGHVTAMTGDGVNDILALKEADCAITVASGSDAARNVSHLVLLNNNFNSMPQVVYEGRRVINNVQSSASLFIMKTFFTMMISIIMLCLPYMNTYPFRTSQMIMIEMFVIGLPAFFLSMQPNDDLVKGKFISYVIKKSLPASITMVLSVIIIEIIKKTTGVYDDLFYNTLSVYALTLTGCINLFFTCKPFNKYRFVLLITALFFVMLTIILTMFGLIPIFQSTFYVMLPMSKYWGYILLVLGIVTIQIPILILLKILFNKIKIKK